MYVFSHISLFVHMHMQVHACHSTHVDNLHWITCSKRLFPSTMLVPMTKLRSSVANTATHGVISLYVFLNLKFFTKQCVVVYAYNPCTCEVEMGESELLGNP